MRRSHYTEGRSTSARRCSAATIRGRSAGPATTRGCSSVPGAPLRLSKIAQPALTAHEAASGPHHRWTKDSARVTADALDALDRHAEATALRARYGIGSP